MSRQFIDIENLVTEYMINRDEDDYGKITSRSRVRNLALAALRDLQYDVLKTFKAVSLDIDQNTLTLDLPNDYIRYIRVGILNKNNEFITLVKNDNLPNINQEYLLDSTGATLLDSDNIEITAYKPVVGQTRQATNYIDPKLIYSDFFYNSNRGRLYGVSGGNSWAGTYRFDNENNRIFFSSDFPQDVDSVILEYLADETMSSNPNISIFAEEAVMNYIYWKHIQRKSNVPRGEKLDAKQNYITEKRKALARLHSPTKAEILSQFWKRNSQTAPKTGGAIYH